MLIALVAVLVVIAVPLTGGRLSALGELRLRRVWLVSIALAVQIIIISVVTDPPPVLSRSLHLATYLCIAIFLVFNRKVPWMWVIAAGGASNFVVITANFGVMPASASALRNAGRTITAGFNNSATVNHARLSFLGDVFATPKTLPLANVFSIGDLVILVGLGLLVNAVCRTRPVAPPAIRRPDMDTATT